MNRVVTIVVFLVFVMLQTSGMSAATEKGLKRNGYLFKVSWELLELKRHPARGPKKRKARAGVEVHSAIELMKFRGDLPVIEVNLRTLNRDILWQIKAAGMSIDHYSLKYAQVVGTCDPALLYKIAAIPEVATIRPNYRPFLNTGAVDSQGDVSIGAADARATLGVDGTGIRVGVLSDTFHDVIEGSVSGAGCSRVLTGSSSQNSGDLPPLVVVLDSGPGGGTDEGAGMAELIHDLAPGAEIMFHSAFNSQSDFAQGITDLVNCGADVIVDDVIYLNEPMFQDGWVAQAAQEAVNNGVAYFSSAGNNADHGIDEDYIDINPAVDFEGIWPPSGNDFHDFGAGNAYADITIPAGTTITVVLQWNDPYDGTLGPGAANDFDLMAYYAPDPGAYIGASANSQGCGAGQPNFGDSYERIDLTNSGGVTATVYLAVNLWCGAKDRRFRVVVFRGNRSGIAYGSMFGESTIYGHAAADDVAAVAAVRYDEIDTVGDVLVPTAGVIDVEPFSSLGGDVPFYFDGSGNPLAGAPVIRFKPELAAPDGTNTTFFGGSDYESDGWPNFFGTSASAPHAAAVAALMLEMNPALTPQSLVSLMQNTAQDIEDAPGWDALSGYGLINASDAVAAAQPPPPSDSDNDGLPDFTEQGPDGDDPNYDGNGDGRPDCQQSNVTSWHTRDTSGGAAIT